MNAGNTICKQTGKRRYVTQGEAKLSMRAFRTKFSKWLGGTRSKRRRTKPRQKRIYFCSFCKGYHLTSQEMRFSKVMAEYRKIRERLETMLRLIR